MISVLFWIFPSELIIFFLNLSKFWYYLIFIGKLLNLLFQLIYLSFHAIDFLNLMAGKNAFVLILLSAYSRKICIKILQQPLVIWDLILFSQKLKNSNDNSIQSIFYVNFLDVFELLILANFDSLQILVDVLLGLFLLFYM